MINYFYENAIQLANELDLSKWITLIIESENRTIGELNFIICDDAYLLKLNKDFLDHDTLTDVIGFDNSLGNQINGEIYISYERVCENALDFDVESDQELRRVMAHGVLHFCGYKDKTKVEKDLMTSKENEKMLLFHVEQ